MALHSQKPDNIEKNTKNNHITRLRYFSAKNERTSFRITKPRLGTWEPGFGRAKPSKTRVFFWLGPTISKPGFWYPGLPRVVLVAKPRCPVTCRELLEIFGVQSAVGLRGFAFKFRSPVCTARSLIPKCRGPALRSSQKGHPTRKAQI